MANRPRFINGGIYHVYNRGVEKRDIFSNQKDHFRFVHDLYEFNDEDRVQNSTFYHKAHGGFSGEIKKKKRKHLVSILAYVLMPNHYHILLMQKREHGVSYFMKKLGAGYTKYFNNKYERSGVLFQGKYKLKPVYEDAYLRHLVSYIHLNPVDLFASKWKSKGIADAKAVEKKLRAYRWSSYSDYVGENNFPSLLDKEKINALGLPWGSGNSDHVITFLKQGLADQYEEAVNF